LELAAHAALPTARLALEGADVVLRANAPLAAGDAISLRHDAAGDFADMFERYGVFDEACAHRTAEVVVPPAFLADGVEARRHLVEAHRQVGCDSAFDAWWVPAESPTSSPLLAALRATVARRVPAAAEDLTQPLADAAEEAAVRAKLVSLLRTWLGGYPTSAADDADALRSADLPADETCAARFVRYEKLLLTQAMRDMRGDVAELHEVNSGYP
jgi:hypothetical protein